MGHGRFPLAFSIAGIHLLAEVLGAYHGLSVQQRPRHRLLLRTQHALVEHQVDNSIAMATTAAAFRILPSYYMHIQQQIVRSFAAQLLRTLGRKS